MSLVACKYFDFDANPLKAKAYAGHVHLLVCGTATDKKQANSGLTPAARFNGDKNIAAVNDGIMVTVLASLLLQAPFFTRRYVFFHLSYCTIFLQ